MNSVSQHLLPVVENDEQPRAWNPQIIEGGLSCTESSVNLNEVWEWYLASLCRIGNLCPEHARLWGTLNWTDTNLRKVMTADNEAYSELSGTEDDRKSYQEFQTGDALARLALY